KEVAHLDITVAVEPFAPGGGDCGSEAAAPPPGEAMGEAETCSVETEPVEPFRTEDGVVDKAFRTGRERQQPHGRPPPAEKALQVGAAAAFTRRGQRPRHLVRGFGAAAQKHQSTS